MALKRPQTGDRRPETDIPGERKAHGFWKNTVCNMAIGQEIVVNELASVSLATAARALARKVKRKRIGEDQYLVRRIL
jgi:hypothetical protein